MTPRGANSAAVGDAVVPGVIHLAGSGTDVRCVDLGPMPSARHEVPKLCGLAFASDGVVGDIEPGQHPQPGKQTFGWSDIAWIHVGNRVAENASHQQDGGGRAQ